MQGGGSEETSRTGSGGSAGGSGEEVGRVASKGTCSIDPGRASSEHQGTPWTLHTLHQRQETGRVQGQTKRQEVNGMHTMPACLQEV